MAISAGEKTHIAGHACSMAQIYDSNAFIQLYASKHTEPNICLLANTDISDQYSPVLHTRVSLIAHAV